MRKVYAGAFEIQDLEDRAGVGWGDRETQERHFENLLGMIPWGKEKVSVCDIGCGVGDLCAWIESRQLPVHSYLGVDLFREMIAKARLKYPGKEFIDDDILNPFADFSADYFVASGVLYRMDIDDAKLAVKNMWDRAGRGVVVNAGGRVDQFELLDFCKSLTRRMRYCCDVPPDCSYILLPKDFV